MDFLRGILTITLLFTASLAPAASLADEPPPAVKAFLANVERQSRAKPSYDALTVDGSGAVTITNFAVRSPPVNDVPTVDFTIAEIRFANITALSPTLWEVNNASFTNTSWKFSANDNPITVDMPSASAEGLYIHGLEADATPQDKYLADSTLLARKLTGGPVAIGISGQKLTIDSMQSVFDGDPKTGSGRFGFTLDRLKVPAEAMALLDQTGMLRQLGYSSLQFDMASDGNMTLADGNMSLDGSVTLKGQDIGNIVLSGAAAGVPMAMMQAEASGQTQTPEEMAAQMKSLTISALAVRFEDASITGKVLPLIAAAQGMDEKTLVAGIPAMLQMSLMQLQNEAFSTQVVDAVSRFLADPRSITLKLAPAKPLTMEDFNSMDPAKPGEAITRLGVSVTANN
jgi:hypothetical protein